MLWKNKKKLAALFAACILMIALLLAGCAADDIDITAYQDESVLFTGLSDQGDVNITVSELKEMDPVTVKTHSTSDKIGTVKATGPKLETILEEYGLSQNEIDSIRIHGTDDYTVKFSHDILSENDVILAYGINGQPLADDSVPVRIIIPRSDSAYWIRMVDRIEIVR